MTFSTATHRVRQVGWAVLAFALGVLIVMAMTTTIQTYLLVDKMRETQQSNTTVLTRVDEVLAVVKDCTQAGGKCFEDGQKRTASAVQDISEASAQASVYAAYCVSVTGNDTVAEIETCVKEQFEISRPKG